MRETQMLFDLGYQPRSTRVSRLAAPAIIGRSDMHDDQRARHWRAASATGQLETPTEVFANTVGLRTTAERAAPYRSAPDKAEV